MKQMKNTAQLIESSGKAAEYRGQEGLFSCLMEHEVKNTKANFSWFGPKIKKEQWQEMLAFFKWTYDTEKSESQVRLFVHPEHGWKIWAFPQKGGTGMTTQEIENDDFRAQRAAIGDGWVAFGTVHHHCSSTAFQSGTDLSDEKNVDGIHITIGKMDSKAYDIHVRLYIKGSHLQPNMSSLWDIGDENIEKLKWVEDMGYSSEKIADTCARTQMCLPPPPETPFNDTWKTNYILPKKIDPFGHGTNGQLIWCNHCHEATMHHTTETCPHAKRRAGDFFGVDAGDQDEDHSGANYHWVSKQKEDYALLQILFEAEKALVSPDDLQVILTTMFSYSSPHYEMYDAILEAIKIGVTKHQIVQYVESYLEDLEEGRQGTETAESEAKDAEVKSGNENQTTGSGIDPDINHGMGIA